MGYKSICVYPNYVCACVYKNINKSYCSRWLPLYEYTTEEEREKKMLFNFDGIFSVTMRNAVDCQLSKKFRREWGRLAGWLAANARHDFNFRLKIGIYLNFLPKYHTHSHTLQLFWFVPYNTHTHTYFQKRNRYRNGIYKVVSYLQRKISMAQK